MNFFNQWMESAWVKALGWTFVHSLWQIAVIGLLLFVIMRLIPGRSAHTRYTVATMSVWMIVITAISTFILMLPEQTISSEINGTIVMLKSGATASVTDKLALWLEANMPMMLTIWFGGVLILMMRLLFSLVWVGHMRTTASVSEELQASMDAIIQRLKFNIKPLIGESIHVESPVTIGHLKPMILFPIGIINRLSPAEVEAVLTHELAHIVRRDYLSNLIQSFIETLFYYHPVTWWISRVVRTERENRADDLAVSWCGDRVAYAKALMTVQQMQISYRPVLAIGFASRKGAMLARIQRILHIPYKNHNQMEKTVLLSLCSLCFLAFTLKGDEVKEQQTRNEHPFYNLLSSFETSNDSIPSKGTYHIHKKTDDQDIRLEVEDGDIRKLEIDGQQIEPSAYESYSEMIDELFGDVNDAPYGQGYHFNLGELPPMPPIPAMPYGHGMDHLPAMPPMPPMPPMDAIEMERFYADAPHITFWGDDQMRELKIYSDSMGEMISKIIILNGDSTVLLAPGAHYEYSIGDMDAFRANMENWQKEWQENWKQHEGEWKEHGEEWRKQLQLRDEELKNLRIESIEGINMEEINKMRDELLMEREHLSQGDWARAYSDKFAESHGGDPGAPRVYAYRSQRNNFADALAEDGLIEAGEEALIQLTPDKLKINGKKMDDETHRKYLKMYEKQQGVELTGNSRVEFRTKTRRSM